MRMKREEFIKKFEWKKDVRSPHKTFEVNRNTRQIEKLEEVREAVKALLNNIEFLKNLQTNFKCVSWGYMTTFEITADECEIPYWMAEKALKKVKVETSEPLDSKELERKQKEKWEELTVEEKLRLVLAVLDEEIAELKKMNEFLEEEMEIPEDLVKYVKA